MTEAKEARLKERISELEKENAKLQDQVSTVEGENANCWNNPPLLMPFRFWVFHRRSMRNASLLMLE